MGRSEQSESEAQHRAVGPASEDIEQALLEGEAAHAGEFNGASFPGAVFNLSTTIVGAGIMALPASMNVLGLIPGILLIALVAVLTERSIDMLIGYNRNVKSYGQLMEMRYGVLGRVALQTLVVVNNVGVMIVYMIIIGDVLSGSTSDDVHHPGVLERWFGVHWWTSRVFVLLATLLLVLGPLTSTKRIDSLRQTSAISVALAIVFVVITAGIAIVKLIQGTIGMPKLFPTVDDFGSIGKLFTTIPVLVTAFICHYNVHNIGNELEDKAQLPKIVRTSLGLCCSIYIATSIFAYLLFGEATQDDVLTNFGAADLGIPFSSVICDIVTLCYAGHIVLVFPVVFFPLRMNLDGLMFHGSKVPLSRDNVRFWGITIALHATVFLTAIFIPSIWDAFQFTGATAAACIGFIFPGMILLSGQAANNQERAANNQERALACFMIVLAILANGIALYSDADALIHPHRASLTGPRVLRMGQ